MTETYIREIFLSIQGEGTHVGEQHLFIRFCGCNLNCAYCDTDFVIEKSKKYTAEELLQEINSYGKNLVLSLTGGEPLLSVEFLLEFLPLAKSFGHKIYLETNGTLPENLKKVIKYIDIIASDIKLKSSAGLDVSFNQIEEFLSISTNVENFAKIVFDENITDDEISTIIKIAKKYNTELILQPKMSDTELLVPCSICEIIFSKFRNNYEKVRLIPQTHKFLNVR